MTIKINKLSLFGALILIGLAIFVAQPALALSPDIRQVKTADSPTVYYLSHSSGLKKAYLNETSYLSYGNLWSEVKIISNEELAKWPSVKLVRTATEPTIYYLQGNLKTAIASSSDLTLFGLEDQAVLTLSQIDLDQYILASYQDIGLNGAGVLSEPVENIASSSLTLALRPVSNATNNNILAGTNSNLIGILELQAGSEAVEIRTIKIDITGVYSRDLIDKVYLTYEDYRVIDQYIHFSDRQVEVNFPDEPYIIAPGQTRTLRVWVNLKPCIGDCSNQTMRAELRSADNIVSNALINNTFPIGANYLKIISVPSLLGSPALEEKPLSLFVSGPNLNLAQLSISEQSGHEDIYLKELVLINKGTASIRDLESFRLQQDGNIISRVSKMADSRKIVFKINYCRISQDRPLTLNVFGQKTSDFNGPQTIDFDIESAWIEGKNLGVYLTPAISNISDLRVIN